MPLSVPRGHVTRVMGIRASLPTIGSTLNLKLLGWGHEGWRPCAWPNLWQRSAAGCPKTPILGNPGVLSPKVSLKNEFSLGTHQAGRVPTWSLYHTHGVAPLRLAPFLGYTGVMPMLIRSHNTPPPQDSCTRGLPKKRVFPGYPTTLHGTHMVPLQHPWGRTPSLGPGLWQRSAAGCPKTPILGPTRPLSPKVSLKNEFSLGTHQAGRVPTWSLYHTHGVAPLRLAPFLGYTGVMPMLIRSHNTPPPQDSCTRGLPKKRVFPGYPPTLHGTHMVPLQHPWGRTPSLGPTPTLFLGYTGVSGNEALPDAQKHLFWVPPGHFRPRSP